MGDLRPNNTIHLKLWTKHSVYEFSFKEFNLTHETGKGKVVWTKKVTGFSRYVSEIWPYALVWLVVLLIYLIQWGISIYPRRKNPIAASAVAYGKNKELENTKESSDNSDIEKIQHNKTLDGQRLPLARQTFIEVKLGCI